MGNFKEWQGGKKARTGDAGEGRDRERGANVFTISRKRAADSSVSGEGGGKRGAGDADREPRSDLDPRTGEVPGEEKARDGVGSEFPRHDPA